MNVAKVLETKGDGKVLTIPPSVSLREFSKKACACNVGALLVMGPAGETLGIISERDVFRQVSRGADLDRTAVSDVMTKGVVFVAPTDDVYKAMDLMVKQSVRHLPVMAGGVLHGFITVRDIMRALHQAEENDIVYLIRHLQESMAAEHTSL